jgi:hypothetical protein
MKKQTKIIIGLVGAAIVAAYFLLRKKPAPVLETTVTDKETLSTFVLTCMKQQMDGLSQEDFDKLASDGFSKDSIRSSLEALWEATPSIAAHTNTNGGSKIDWLNDNTNKSFAQSEQIKEQCKYMELANTNQGSLDTPNPPFQTPPITKN